jgi:TRAP-type mannitol/chloroaromatic compound transport system permease large subunit
MMTDLLLSLELPGTAVLLAIMALIFVLGWPLEWVPIVLVIVPIVVPVLKSLDIDLTWFGILVAVNLQTAWLSPPVALSAYFLKGVVPDWSLSDIYKGMMQFMVLQLLGLIIILIFPQIALWLPTVLYGR